MGDADFDNLEKAAARRRVRIAFGSLAFVPPLVIGFLLWLNLNNFISDSTARSLSIPCAVFLLPALSFGKAMATLVHDKHLLMVTVAAIVVLWCSLLSMLIAKIVGFFQGEDEALCDRGKKFDWIAFQVRFFCGFVIGFLSGWRLAKNSTSMRAVLIASLIGGVIGGIIFGLKRPPNFWSRGF